MTIRIVYVLFFIALESCSYKAKNKFDSIQNVGDKVEIDSSSGVVGIGVKPGKFAGEYIKAANLITEKKYTEAIHIYLQLTQVEEDGTKTDAYLGLGSAYYLNKDYQNALKNYFTSLELDSNNIGALVGIGSVNLDLKNYKESIKRYELAKVKDPKLAECYWGLAEAYDERGIKSKAKQNASKFIELQPNSNYVPLMKEILNH